MNSIEETQKMDLGEFRTKVCALEEKINQLPNALVEREHIDAVNPLEHFFGDGMYIRKITMPAGQLIVSKIHRQKHPFFILEGKASVLTEEGVQHIEAPYFGMTPAGTKRVLYIHEKTVWITVQNTEETDMEAIEKDVMAPNFNDLEITQIEFNLLTKGKECLS